MAEPIKINDRAEVLFEKFRDGQTLEAAKQYAKWTVASLFPESSDTLDNTLTDTRKRVSRDFQSIGALLLNNLSAKISQLLFPIEMPFFTIEPTQASIEFAEATGNSTDTSVLNSYFADLANKASRRVFINGGFNQILMALKLSAATGDALLFRDPETKRFQVYSLMNFVCKRDGSGNPLLIILKEKIAYIEIPEEYKPLANASSEWDNVDLYTVIKRRTTTYPKAIIIDGEETIENVTAVMYDVHQEINNHKLGDGNTYPEMLCPYITLPWTLINGENYGRGIVEEYSADLARLSELANATLNYEVEIMRLIHLASPEVMNNAEQISQAENGEVVGATASTLEAYEGGDGAKLQQVLGDASIVEERLSRAFMYTGNVRQAERVTAEEIRTMVREADYTLGGVYSSLTELLHIKLAHILLVEEDETIGAALVEGGFTLDINVGLASLNRQSKVAQLQRIANGASLIIPALAQVTQRFNNDKILEVLFESENYPITDVSYTDEELAEKQAQEEEAMLADAAALQEQDPNNVALNAEQQGLV